MRVPGDEAHEDRWSRWVGGRAFGDDEEQRAAWGDRLAAFRERVLDGARLEGAETLLDLGTGDGLVAFGALARLDPAGRVIFSDVSEPLLDRCRRRAGELGVLDRARFLRASADDLRELGPGSVDVVTTRAVLIYLPLERKRAALRELHRVLSPGGRLSLFEPINAWFGPFEEPDRLWGYDVAPVQALADSVRAEYERVTPASASPLMDFDEHDLVAGTLAAGFRPVELDVEVRVEPGAWVRGWDALLAFAGNPLEPAFGEVVDAALDPAEREAFAAHLRPLVEAGEGERRFAFAYLRAVKPAG